MKVQYVYFQKYLFFIISTKTRQGTEEATLTGVSQAGASKDLCCSLQRRRKTPHAPLSLLRSKKVCKE